MIINENLLNDKQVCQDMSNWENYSWKAVRFNLPDNLIDGKTYTASFTIKQGENGSGYSSIIIFNSKKEIAMQLTNEYLNIPISNLQATFTYSSKNMAFIDFCIDVFGKTSDKTGTFIKAKIEVGNKMTPYLPYKTNVKPVNQAIFPIGGGYSKRFIHSRYTGGGIC